MFYGQLALPEFLVYANGPSSLWPLTLGTSSKLYSSFLRSWSVLRPVASKLMISVLSFHGFISFQAFKSGLLISYLVASQVIPFSASSYRVPVTWRFSRAEFYLVFCHLLTHVEPLSRTLMSRAHRLALSWPLERQLPRMPHIQADLTSRPPCPFASPCLSSFLRLKAFFSCTCFQNCIILKVLSYVSSGNLPTRVSKQMLSLFQICTVHPLFLSHSGFYCVAVYLFLLLLLYSGRSRKTETFVILCPLPGLYTVPCPWEGSRCA